LLLVLTGCAGAPVTAPQARAAVVDKAPAASTMPPTAPPVAQQPAQQEPVPAAPELGPEILLPKPDDPDAEVARVDDLVLRRSHAFTRLLSANPKLALEAVDNLVFDVLIARHAKEHGIRVKPERVEALAAKEEESIKERVKAELGANMDLQTYVWRVFGMRLQDWQTALRVRTARWLYHGYVIRYLALREDRVQVRYLVHKDQAVAQEVVEKVRAGADFATLALRWSEDASRRDGGLMPPFSRGFRHPVVDTAFSLKKGEVSAPFVKPWGDGERWYVVYCLDRLPGRDVPFAEVRDEIDRDLESRPLAQLEMNAYQLRWRGELEAKAKAAADAQNR
jgi:parvulin-like peptidyl-prolyl isomerase